MAVDSIQVAVPFFKRPVVRRIWRGIDAAVAGVDGRWVFYRLMRELLTSGGLCGAALYFKPHHAITVTRTRCIAVRLAIIWQHACFWPAAVPLRQRLPSAGSNLVNDLPIDRLYIANRVYFWERHVPRKWW